MNYFIEKLRSHLELHRESIDQSFRVKAKGPLAFVVSY